MIDVDPLATYLRRRFGDVDEDAACTPELRSAVVSFLTQLPIRSFDTLLLESMGQEPRPLARELNRQDAAELLVDTQPLSELISAAHWMSVYLAPSLEELRDSLSRVRPSPSADQVYMSMGEWLDKNATAKERSALIHELDPAYFFISAATGDKDLYVTDWLEWKRGPVPQLDELMLAWKQRAQQSSR